MASVDTEAKNAMVSKSSDDTRDVNSWAFPAALMSDASDPRASGACRRADTIIRTPERKWLEASVRWLTGIVATVLSVSSFRHVSIVTILALHLGIVSSSAILCSIKHVRSWEGTRYKETILTKRPEIRRPA